MAMRALLQSNVDDMAFEIGKSTTADFESHEEGRALSRQASRQEVYSMKSII